MNYLNILLQTTPTKGGFEQYSVIMIALIFVVFYFLFIRPRQKKSNEKEKEKIFITLNEYGLTFSDMMLYYCHYVGGHPEQDSYINGSSILFGAKNGKLIFFDGFGIHFKKTAEGNLTPNRKLDIAPINKLTYLFDIPINRIKDICCFDATTSRPVGLIGGNNWAIPINMKKEDASVLIYWNDGKFNHSTEFRLNPLVSISGGTRSIRANKLRNTLMRMTKENIS